MMGRTFTQQMMMHIVAMAAVVLAGVAYTFSGATAHAAYDHTSPLLVNTRSTLEVCAQVAPALKDKHLAIANKLNERMSKLKATHPKWNDVHGKAAAAPAFSTSCTIKIPNQLIDEADPTVVGKGYTSKPSPFRAIVLVVDDATADIALGKLNIKHAAYEMMWVSEHEAVEVTNALVVREGYLDTQEFVDQYLSVAVSLEPVKPYELPEGVTTTTIKPAGHDASN
jgi:hypothetical protein